MKIKILDTYSYQSFPIVDGMIEVNEEDLKLIGNGKKFDLTTNTIVEDTEYQARKEQEENQVKISELKSWFNNNYRMYVEMLTRRESLNISDTIIDSYRNKTYTNLNDLYLEAEVVASEIKNLEVTNEQ